MSEATINPIETLRAGCDILDEVLLPHGFQRGEITSGKGSGGHFAMCFYGRADRRLELHFRWALGIVVYHFGTLSASHEDYMLTMLGFNGGNHYPGFARNDPLEHFRQVSYDLKNFGDDFFNGDGRSLKRAAVEGPPKRKSRLP